MIITQLYYLSQVAQLYYSLQVANQLYRELVRKFSSDKHTSNSPKQNYALANFVDGDEYIYGCTPYTSN